ncbi:hypothetical protein LNQ03_28825 [Klebsiella pneumoniae subsp. pneumoniae]|nr:hypothetical protein [Klebsiella pneumoniae subsp. pneumoniae]
MPAAPPLARHTDQGRRCSQRVSVPFARWWRLGRMGDQYPVDQLRGGPTLGLHLLRALLRIRLSPFRSLTLLMQTLVLLSLFSFVVKFGPMVQVTDLWQFLLFLFPLLTTMQLLRTAVAQYAGLWGTAYRLYGARLSPSPTRRCTIMRPFQ